MITKSLFGAILFDPSLTFFVLIEENTLISHRGFQNDLSILSFKRDRLFYRKNYQLTEILQKLL